MQNSRDATNMDELREMEMNFVKRKAQLILSADEYAEMATTGRGDGSKKRKLQTNLSEEEKKMDTEHSKNPQVGKSVDEDDGNDKQQTSSCSSTTSKKKKKFTKRVARQEKQSKASSGFAMKTSPNQGEPSSRKESPREKRKRSKYDDGGQSALSQQSNFARDMLASLMRNPDAEFQVDHSSSDGEFSTTLDESDKDNNLP